MFIHQKHIFLIRNMFYKFTEIFPYYLFTIY